MSWRYFFDVDGVVLDFESTFIRVVGNYFKLEIPEGFQTTHWSFSDILSWEQVKEGWEYFLLSKEFEQMPSLVDPELFNSTFRAYPVHFITNIPLKCLERRQRNLKRLGYDFSSIHCAGFVNYEDHPTQTKADVIRELLKDEEHILFVDDHPDNCINVHEAFPEGEVWLMSRGHNKDFEHSKIHRAYHWEEVLNFPREAEH